jgi:hypothetical protein
MGAVKDRRILESIEGIAASCRVERKGCVKSEVNQHRLKIDQRTIINILFLLVILGVFLVVVMKFLPAGVDWLHVFRPAALAITRWQSPFSIDGYFNAPWAAIALIPLAVLPEKLGYGLLILFSLMAFAYTAHRLGAGKIAILFFLLSPLVMHGLLNGNIDALVALGFVLPPQIGLFFILIKPQMGIAVAVYWLVETFRERGIRGFISVFGPVILVTLVSFLFFGLWPLRFEEEIDLWWNASLWPASLPVGIVLIVTAIRHRRIEYAMAASPCFSPYVLFHAWVGALLAVVAQTPETIAAVLGLWLLVILRSFGG